jgi:hypothetical protein
MTARYDSADRRHMRTDKVTRQSGIARIARYIETDVVNLVG